MRCNIELKFFVRKEKLTYPKRTEIDKVNKNILQDTVVEESIWRC
jgi:hypothetical protein